MKTLNAFFVASIFSVSMLFLACDESTVSADTGSPDVAETDTSRVDSAVVDSVKATDEISSSSEAASSESKKITSSSSESKRITSSTSWHFHGRSSSSSKEDKSSSSEEVIQSSSEEQIPSSSSKQDALSEECKAIRSNNEDFNKITDVIPCVQENEKVAYILRHAERNKSATGNEGKLNDNGRKQSIEFGQKLKDLDSIYFMHTKVHRSMETVLKIAEGKEQKFSETSIPFKKKDAEDHLETDDLEDAYFVTGNDELQRCRNAIQSKFNWSWGWSPYSYVAYEDNVISECKMAFYDIDDRIEDLIQKYFTYEKMHKITMAISHDKFMVPFIIAISNRKIDLKFHEHENDFNYWINYLTGVAIIVNSENEVIMLPVTALKDPYLRTFPDN